MERHTSRTASSSTTFDIQLQAVSRAEFQSGDHHDPDEDYHNDHNGHRFDPLTQEQEQAELKPVDGGRDAWQLLISAFIFEALFWGFPTSYGVFQAYYTSLPQFANDISNIAVIGTLAQGLAYLGAPFSAFLTKRFPRHQKVQLIFGWSLCITGLLTASFAESVSTLIVTQGMVYGLGFIIHTYPILNMVNEWWITRKGMAFGLISAASGLTGMFMPLVLEALLHRYGYQITLRACAIAMFVLTAPMIPLLRGRLPPPAAVSSSSQKSASKKSSSLPNRSFSGNNNNNNNNNNNAGGAIISSSAGHAQYQDQGERQQPMYAAQARTDWSFLRKRLFYVYALAMTVQGFGFFIPPIFITSYAISLGIPSLQAASLLAVMALFQTLGQFAFGWLSDKNWAVSVLAGTCSTVAATATLLCWGLGKALGPLMIYAVLYGFFAFAFSTLRVAMGRAVTKEQSAVLATYSTLVFVQGIGNILVGPVAAALMGTSSQTFDADRYGGGVYKGIIIFVAASSTVAALLCMIAPQIDKAVPSSPSPYR